MKERLSQRRVLRRTALLATVQQTVQLRQLNRTSCCTRSERLDTTMLMTQSRALPSPLQQHTLLLLLLEVLVLQHLLAMVVRLAL